MCEERESVYKERKREENEKGCSPNGVEQKHHIESEPKFGMDLLLPLVPQPLNAAAAAYSCIHSFLSLIIKPHYVLSTG